MQPADGSFHTVTYKKPSRQVTAQNSIKGNDPLALDVTLWGFPVKPACESVVLKFLNIYGMPTESVNSFHQFENQERFRTFYHIVITFKDKQSKSKLFTARNNRRKPLRWHDFTGACTHDHNTTIKFGSRNRRGTQLNKESCGEQRPLDLDIILSGFPVGADCDSATFKFLHINGVPIENVKSFYQFENKVVITFKDEQSRSDVLMGNNRHRPIRWQDLTDVVHSKDCNPIIEFCSRFNYCVEMQLYLLKRHRIISEYKFDDSFYSYKQAAAGKWRIVSTKEDLEDLIDLLQHVKL